MQTRSAKTRDLPDLVRILEQARLRLQNLGIDQWQNGYPDDRTLMSDVIRGTCRLSESGGSVMGFYVLTASPEPAYDKVTGRGWLTRDDQYLVVHRLAVNDAQVGHGTAALLLLDAEAETRKRNIRLLRADTHRGNLPMQRLLVRMGFRQCGEIDLGPDYSGDSSRLVYEKCV